MDGTIIPGEITRTIVLIEDDDSELHNTLASLSNAAFLTTSSLPLLSLSFILIFRLFSELRVFLGGGGVEVAEGGSEAERTVQFTVSRDGNATLNRDVLVTLSTADDSATGVYCVLCVYNSVSII